MQTRSQPPVFHAPAQAALKPRLSTPTPAGGPLFIAGVSSAGTHFVDQNGNPRMIVNEDNWALLANGGAYVSYLTEWTNYFTSRRAQGYNSVEVTWCSFAQPNASFVFNDGRDWDGTYPFATNMDPTTAATATFWQRRDEFFAMAQTYGFTVVCNITTTWLFTTDTPQRNWTLGQWQAFGTFLGNRYKNVPNILWILGDDYFGDIDTNLNAMVTNLRATGDTHPLSVQLYQEGTSRQDIFTLTKDPIDICKLAEYEWCYSYNVSYDSVEKAHLYTVTAGDLVQHVVPPLWGDGHYVASSTGAGQTDVKLERQMIWWSLSSGACGFSTGDNDIWGWSNLSAGYVTSKAIYSSWIPAIATAFGGLSEWWKLTPDTSSVLVTGGRGTHASALVSGGSATYYTANTDNYVTASRTPDTGSGSSLAVIYCGLAFSITIDQSKMKAGYTVTWLDPVNGATQSGTPGSTYNSSAAVGNNSAGEPDWVLILRG